MQASGKYRLSRIASRKPPCKPSNGKSWMATAIWRGSITFGLVSIPIRLYAAARPKRIALHQLHNKCHTRLKQPLFCPTCNRFVERSEVVKGYEYEKGQYVLVEPEEIKKITPASGQAMDILAFVDESQVDPIYFDSSFLAVPPAQGLKADRLLLKALDERVSLPHSGSKASPLSM